VRRCSWSPLRSGSEAYLQRRDVGLLRRDVGLLRFDADGNVTFERGQHQGLDGDVAGLCAALSP
jgi:hypothetical protein